MELPPVRDLAYFQAELAESDPFGAETLARAAKTLDTEIEIRAFLNEYVAWRFSQQPRPEKGNLRMQIHNLTRYLFREIEIKSPSYSMQKSLAAVWRDAMNAHPSLKL